MSPLPTPSVIAVTSDRPDDGLVRGQVGTMVEVWATGCMRPRAATIGARHAPWSRLAPSSRCNCITSPSLRPTTPAKSDKGLTGSEPFRVGPPREADGRGFASEYPLAPPGLCRAARLRAMIGAEGDDGG